MHNSPQSQIRIPYDSNLRYLPLMYFLPQDMIVKCPTLYALPRRIRDILYSEEVTAIVNSDAFLSEIMDAVASLAFPHFGFGGWKEDYTGHHPAWKLSYSLGLWAGLLEKETGLNLQALMYVPSSEDIPFFPSDEVNTAMERIVRRGIEEQGWQPILDAVRKMPCDEDFEKWNSNVRKDFLRKWYHTRSKRVKMISLESCTEDENHRIYDIAVDSYDLAEHAASDDYCKRFESRLSKRDMEILKLRSDGFTYAEIAEKLGYKNHSGVIKRIRAITKEFLKFEEEQR